MKKGQVVEGFLVTPADETPTHLTVRGTEGGGPNQRGRGGEAEHQAAKKISKP